MFTDVYEEYQAISSNIKWRKLLFLATIDQKSTVGGPTPSSGSVYLYRKKKQTNKQTDKKQYHSTNVN